MNLKLQCQLSKAGVAQELQKISIATKRLRSSTDIDHDSLRAQLAPLRALAPRRLDALADNIFFDESVIEFWAYFARCELSAQGEGHSLTLEFNEATADIVYDYGEHVVEFYQGMVKHLLALGATEMRVRLDASFLESDGETFSRFTMDEQGEITAKALEFAKEPHASTKRGKKYKALYEQLIDVRIDLDLAKSLVDDPKVDLNARLAHDSDECLSAFHLLCETRFPIQAEPLLRHMLQTGRVDPNQVLEDWKDGEPETRTELLFEPRFDLGQRALTPLQRVVNQQEKAPGMVRALIEHGADVNVRDALGVPVIGYAGYPEEFDLLLEAGARLDGIEKWGYFLLNKIIYQLERHQDEQVLCASLHSHLSRVLQLGVNPNIDKFNLLYSAHHLPLHSAVVYGDFRAVKFLLSSGADPNQQDFTGATPIEGITPKLSANSAYALECIKLLLDHGADVNYQRLPTSPTPITRVIRSLRGDNNSYDKFRYEALQYLIDNGANVNAPVQASKSSPIFRTAQDFANLRDNCPELQQILKAAGAKTYEEFHGEDTG